jgi:uncharacterized membrane protein YccC
VRGAIHQAIGSAWRVDWSQFEGPAALRCTVGVAIPLVAGLALGQQSAGVFGAVGALSVGFGSFQGVYRSRATIMMAAACGMALSIFVGSVAGHSPIGAVAVAAIWGFGCGMLVSLGPAASFVALQSGVAAIVATGFPSDAATALGRLLAVLAGGAIQTILVVVLWPLQRFPEERRALANVYRTLASYAFTIPGGASASPDAMSLHEAQPAFRDPQPFAKTWQALALRSLLDEAERIRASLAALALHHGRQANSHAHPEAFAGFAEATGQLLREIAAALDEAREPSASKTWELIEQSARQLQQNRAIVDGLLGQLRSAWRVAGVMTGSPANDVRAGVPVRPLRRLPPIHDALATLRANLTLESTAFRHAIRLAVTLAIATEWYRVAGFQRGYWLPMTALVVLKPEFQGTFAAGLARVAGTLLGAVGATLLTIALQPGPVTLIGLALGFVWCGYALFRTNYTVFVFCLTGYVVFLLAIAGLPERTAAVYRSEATALGGALALLIYAAWPTWEGAHVRDLLADLFDAHRRYAAALFEALIAGSKPDRTRIGFLRGAARLARSNAEASIQRMLGEPESRRSLDGDAAVGLLATTRRHGLAALALQARVEREPMAPCPELQPLADQIDQSFRTLAQALREGTLPQDLPPLRATQEQLKASTRSSVVDETDVTVDSLNTMGELLRKGGKV